MVESRLIDRSHASGSAITFVGASLVTACVEALDALAGDDLGQAGAGELFQVHQVAHVGGAGQAARGAEFGLLRNPSPSELVRMAVPPMMSAGCIWFSFAV